MSELIRTIVGRLRAVVANRRHEPRKGLRLVCSVSLHDPKAKATASASTRRAPSLECHTRDLSATGLALVAPSIRVNDRYLTNTTLRLLLEHPAGTLEIIAQPVRYEQLPPDSDETGYLIGVHIISMSDDDRIRYEQHLTRA
ncbi:MAG: hypothetical protein QOE33_2369 [Acidobacteriota bacterium]|nr:hypothetical protein [Acidobacteriota bacterium]